MYTCIKPKTWLEEMLAEQLSYNVKEAYLCVSMEEMLISGYIDWFLENHLLNHK